MYNRKINSHKDFGLMLELENEMMPIIDQIKNADEKEKLKNYVRKTFLNQFKNATNGK